MPRQTQAAYDQGHIHGLDAAGNLNGLIRKAMYTYLREDLGLSEDIAQKRADLEVSGGFGADVCEECENAGLSFKGKRVLDLGAGLGGLSAAVARRGANLVSLEPGENWRAIASLRLKALGDGEVIGGVGESLPLADNSVDIIVSLQVLEHVNNPAKVISEAFRVLKPGGYLYMTYENYLSFWEPHYRVRWLPLLPKPLGAAYLRALGRNPAFLIQAVTYTTFPKVRRAMLNTGFQCVRRMRVAENLRSPSKTSLKWKVLKMAGSLTSGGAVAAVAAVDYLNRTLRTNVEEFMFKPPGPKDTAPSR